MAVIESEITEQARFSRRIVPDERHIGQLLLRAGKLTPQAIKVVVLEQRRQGLRFGDAALRLGFVTDFDIQSALSRQYEYPYLNNGESALSTALIAAYQPFSVQAEALRALRTQLMLRWFRERNRVLAVVAARAGAGCSVLSANLAVTFAQLGKRTLLIDANLRAPRQRELFGLKADLGLSSVLAGRSSLAQAPAVVAPFDNLAVLCAGPKVPNPQELLGRTSFANVIDAAPTAFEVVIVDAPPTLDYADAQVIAARSRGCLLVARRHSTRVVDVTQAEAKLALTGASLLGSVLCD
jgi:protein-tyrosine kinase